MYSRRSWYWSYEDKNWSTWWGLWVFFILFFLSTLRWDQWMLYFSYYLSLRIKTYLDTVYFVQLKSKTNVSVILSNFFLALPLETDDLMGRAWADETGHFTGEFSLNHILWKSITVLFLVSGCGSDFGPLNSPDPYLTVSHFCPRVKDGTTSDERKFQVIAKWLYSSF